MSLAVIIPNYNKERYIRQCVDSIMQQSVLPDEIWIIDDCSKDNSRQIIEQIQATNSRVHTIFFENNRGVSAARNAGILSAGTEYITTLDSDDYIFDCNKLKNEMECIYAAEKHGQKRVFAYSKTVPVTESGKIRDVVQYSRKLFLKGKIAPQLLATYQLPGTIPRDYCIRKDYIIEAGLYDESSSYFEDYDLLIRVLKQNVALFTNGNGVAYRYVSTGLSHQGNIPYRERMKEIKEKYLHDFSYADQIRYGFYRCIAPFRRKVIEVVYKIKGFFNN